jgi:hypothetical protein
MKLTKRQKQLRAILILAAMVAAFSVVMNLWWVGDGFCWGSMTECMLRESK